VANASLEGWVMDFTGWLREVAAPVAGQARQCNDSCNMMHILYDIPALLHLI